MLNRPAPDFKTLANFRVGNREALVRVCAAFVQFCRTQSLYGGEQIASYNVQTVLDGKYQLIADIDMVQDANDQNQLYRMARRAKARLKGRKLEVSPKGDS